LSGGRWIFGGGLGLVRRRAGPPSPRHSHLKGFAFEYMTGGEALVLGDPGPWLAAGMSGGTVFIRVGGPGAISLHGLRQRIARGAKVEIGILDGKDTLRLEGLLKEYEAALAGSGQHQEAGQVGSLRGRGGRGFRKLVPRAQQVDPSLTTE
jgi:glutamate synthase (NADPH/NADH) large chain